MSYRSLSDCHYHVFADPLYDYTMIYPKNSPLVMKAPVEILFVPACEFWMSELMLF